MKSVFVRLKEYQNQSSQVEESVLNFIIKNPEQVSAMSIHELASKTFASASSIIRMVRKLGFCGYKEFRHALIYEIAMHKQSAEDEKKEITKFDSIEEIAEKITYKNIISLENTKNLLDYETLAKCVELLCRSRNICLFGIGSSLVVARDAHLKFLRLNKPCLINDDWHSQLLQARNMSKDDVGIIFSYSGQTVEMIECAKAMREVGACIISVTRYEACLVAELSDYQIYVAANESTFRSGAMSSRISQLNVIDILFTAFANKEYEYCLQQLSKTHITKPLKTTYKN
ncbi:MurR/RpiR family transcriptional regulator [Oscillospiraceae bacterium PP1C4]